MLCVGDLPILLIEDIMCTNSALIFLKTARHLVYILLLCITTVFFTWLRVAKLLGKSEERRQ